MGGAWLGHRHTGRVVVPLCISSAPHTGCVFVARPYMPVQSSPPPSLSPSCARYAVRLHTRPADGANADGASEVAVMRGGWDALAVCSGRMATRVVPTAASGMLPRPPSLCSMGHTPARGSAAPPRWVNGTRGDESIGVRRTRGS
jgi:hypothetical protein